MSNSRTEEQQVMFMNRMVETYGKVHNEKYWEQILPHIKEKAKGVCMDLGCGPGLLLEELDRRFKPTKLIGVDVSPVMLNKASEILKTAKSENRVKLIERHLQQDPSLPDNVDIIFSSRVLRSFEDPVVIFNSIHQSLNENGLLVILDWDKANIATYMKYFSDNFADADFQEQVRLQRIFSRYGLDDWEVILTNTGFEVIHAYQLDMVHVGIIGRKI